MIQRKIAELVTLDGTHVWPPHYRKSVCWITKVPGVSRQRSVEGKTHFVLLFVREIVLQLLFARLSSKTITIPSRRKRESTVSTQSCQTTDVQQIRALAS
jgi:hypothetical protein